MKNRNKTRKVKMEMGITLIALIITIIILVILTAVSIKAVADMGIVGIATNGVQDYSSKAVEENEMMDNTTAFIDRHIEVLDDIENERVAITNTTISSTSTAVEVGSTTTLTLTINPENATEIPEWTSSNTDVATISVSSDGKTATITGVASGTATISATNSTNNCTVTVTTTCCFDPGSQILMADGTTKNIEDITVGEEVMSLNEETGEFISQKITRTVVKHNSDDLVYVNLSNGARIGMRAYHPLLTTEGWKSLRPELAETTMETGMEVELLEVGDTLIGYDENATIVSIETRPEIENYDTYNFSVEGFHNYIVDGVVAHNSPEPSAGSAIPVVPNDCSGGSTHSGGAGH